MCFVIAQYCTQTDPIIIKETLNCLRPRVARLETTLLYYLDGVNGTDGEPGTPGVPGQVGEVGMRGMDGGPGQRGMPGQQGPTGAPGESSIDGRDGADGVDGLQGERVRYITNMIVLLWYDTYKSYCFTKILATVDCYLKGTAMSISSSHTCLTNTSCIFAGLHWING